MYCMYCVSYPDMFSQDSSSATNDSYSFHLLLFLTEMRMERQDAASLLTSSLLKKSSFSWYICEVRWWTAYAITAWTDSFLRQATTSSQILPTRRKNWAKSDGTSPLGAKP